VSFRLYVARLKLQGVSDKVTLSSDSLFALMGFTFIPTTLSTKCI
jgi:hypothetical protein